MARDEPQATTGDDAEDSERRPQPRIDPLRRRPDAAGIDIGNEIHYVAVPPSRDSEPVRRFGCTTGELKAMAAWLKQCRIRTVAMQSTGVIGSPVYEILERAGFEVYLVNARGTKNLPGRKSDVFGESSLRRALQQYVLHYHEERNHQGKENRILLPSQTKARTKEGAVRFQERLGGLLRYYERAVA